MPKKLMSRGGVLRIRRLYTETELHTFADHYARHSGYSVPLDYLRRSHVFGGVDGTALTCGFVLGVSAPFRTFIRIPAPDRARCEVSVDSGDTQEFTCVWLEPGLRRNWRSYLFWWEILRQAGKVGKRAVLVGTEVPALREFYESTRPRPLYAGPVVVDGIEKTGWVYVHTIDRRYAGIVRMVWYKLRRAALRSGVPARTSVPVTGGKEHHGHGS
jgi:hypothetical protein